MGKNLKIGILRETKNPPDRRVPLTPGQIIELRKMYPSAGFIIQPGKNRCYTDDEYKDLDISLVEDLSECDILMGVKEVDMRTLIPEKTYIFFAHVAKKQPQNRAMFRAISDKRISLIDYEYLTTEKGDRAVAFGRWAGIVGAYNGLRANGVRSKRFDLKPAHKCHDLNEMFGELDHIEIEPRLKILITGGGRVANGALETLGRATIRRVSTEDFLNREFDYPVMCQVGPENYAVHKRGQSFSFNHFIKHPEEYETAFLPFIRVTDILITGHYWDPRAPVFFTKADMKSPEFRISVIADISCDINGPIPSTLRASSIADPFFGYNRDLEIEEPAFRSLSDVTVMSIDNLPGELPRDASLDFGRQLMQNTIHDLLSGTESPMIERATILKNGKLTAHFSYLSEYLNDPDA